MADAVLPSQQPGFSESYTDGPVEILASMVGYRQKGVTLNTDAAVYLAGTPLAFNSVTGYTERYTNAGETAKTFGILRFSVDATAGPQQGNVVTSGELKLGLLPVDAVSAAAMTDLGARSDADLDTFTF